MLSGDGFSTPSRDDGNMEQQSLTDCQSNHSPMSVLVASGVDGTTLPPIEQGGHRAVHSCAGFDRGVPWRHARYVATHWNGGHRR